MEEAEYLCNRVAIMDSGEILAINDPHQLINDLSHTTQVSFLSDSEVDSNIFAGINGVEKMYSTAPKMIVEINNLEIIGDMVRRLNEKNINFSSFTVKTATLEDVYLDLTGKAFEE
jgi:ABC-2 type transport system ATP-binding protein